MKPEGTPEQIAKLPKWAQEQITNSNRIAEQAKRKLAELMDNSKVSGIYAKVHTLAIGDRFYIQSDEVTFVLGAREEISIRLEDGRLHCMGSGSVRTQLVVKPRVTNVIDLCLE